MAPKLKAPADDVLAAVATEHSLAFEALAADSSFVKLHMRMANAVSGLTSKAMVPSCLAASDCALGAIQLDFVTEVDERGSAINVASNISSAQTANVAPCVHSQPARTQSPQPALHAAPPLHDSLFYASFVASRVGSTGSAKTFTMNLGPRALGASTAACRGSKYTKIRELAGHIPICKDGTSPTLLADDSAACARSHRPEAARTLAHAHAPRPSTPRAALCRVQSNSRCSR